MIIICLSLLAFAYCGLFIYLLLALFDFEYNKPIIELLPPTRSDPIDFAIRADKLTKGMYEQTKLRTW